MFCFVFYVSCSSLVTLASSSSSSVFRRCCCNVLIAWRLHRYFKAKAILMNDKAYRRHRVYDEQNVRARLKLWVYGQRQRAGLLLAERLLQRFAVDDDEPLLLVRARVCGCAFYYIYLFFCLFIIILIFFY